MTRSLQTLALWILSAVAFLIPLSPELGSISLRPEDPLVLALGGLLVLDVAYGDDRTLRIPGGQFFFALLALWLLGVVSSAIGAVFGTAELLSLSPIESATLTILKEAELVALFLATAWFVDDADRLRRLLAITILASGLLSGAYLFEIVSLPKGSLVPRASYHLMGEIFGIGACLSFGSIVFGDESPLDDRISLVALPLTGLGVLASGEAGAILGAATAGGVFAVLLVGDPPSRITPARLALAGVGVVSVLFGIWVFVPLIFEIALRQVNDLINAVSGTPGTSAQIRFRNWQRRNIEVLTQRPVLGFGQIAIPTAAIDNEYLQRLYYTGVLGLGTYLLFLVSGFRYAISSIERDETGYLAGFAGVVGVVVGAGMSKGVLHSAKVGMLFVFVSSLVFGLVFREAPSSNGSQRGL